MVFRQTVVRNNFKEGFEKALKDSIQMDWTLKGSKLFEGTKKIVTGEKIAFSSKEKGYPNVGN